MFHKLKYISYYLNTHFSKNNLYLLINFNLFLEHNNIYNFSILLFKSKLKTKIDDTLKVICNKCLVNKLINELHK